VAVEGLKTTAYSLTAEVRNKKDETIIELTDGQSFRS
jgi:hypothetical protein